MCTVYTLYLKGGTIDTPVYLTSLYQKLIHLLSNKTA